MNNDLNISMKIVSSDNINMKLEDSKPIDVNMSGGIVEVDPIFRNSPAYTITYNDINIWNHKSNFSGNYNDLTNKPTIPTQVSQLTNDVGYITKNVNNLVNYTLSSSLSSVALTGDYDDLLNKPTIPTKTSDLDNDSGFIDKNVTDLNYYTLTSNLSVVATTGSYNDLYDTPELANVATTGLYDDLINKPTLATVASTGDYDDLIDKPTIPTKTSELTNDSGFITNANIPTKTSDLTNDSGFITNTVNDLTNYTLSSSLATVATTGSYNDLSNTPTIPVVPTNVSSFNNDAGYITKSVNDLTNYTLSSSLSSVATSGSYNDLSNKPTIPTAETINIYSSTEEVVGTWLGKPLYRIVVTYPASTVIGASGSQTDINIPHSISNLKSCVNCSARLYYSGSESVIKPLPQISGSSTVNSSTIIREVNNTNIILRITNDTWNKPIIDFILEYTKTTD